MKVPAKLRWPLIILAALLSGIEIVIQVLLAYEIKPSFIPVGLFAIISGLVTVAAFSTRTIIQADDD